MNSFLQKGLYKHLISGNLYNVLGVGRLVENPKQFVVVYEQLYENKLRGTDISLPVKSIWVRKYDDFTSIDENGKRKFEFIKN